MTVEQSATPTITVTVVAQDERDTIDTEFRTITGGIPTPLPAASDLFVAGDAAGNVLGASYIHIRHLMGPYVLAEGSPLDTLTRLADAITDQLRSTVRESLLARNESADVASDFGLSYDVYVPVGHSAPSGFERLDVEVWRRRVC